MGGAVARGHDERRTDLPREAVRLEAGAVESELARHRAGRTDSQTDRIGGARDGSDDGDGDVGRRHRRTSLPPTGAATTTGDDIRTRRQGRHHRCSGAAMLTVC